MPFIVGDEIAEDIVASLDVKLAHGEDARVWRKALKTPRAREVFNEGMSLLFGSLTQPINNSARELFLEVARLEPEAAQGYATAGATHCLDLIHGWSRDRAASLAEAKRLADKACDLDASIASRALREVLCGAVRRPARRSTDGRRARGGTAADVRRAARRPGLCAGLQRTVAARVAERAQRRSSSIPCFPSWYLYLMAAAQYFSGQAAESLVTLQSVNPGLLAGRVLRVAALSGVQRNDEARAEAAAIVRDHPDFSLERYAASQPFRDAAQRAAYLQILSDAGLPG